MTTNDFISTFDRRIRGACFDLGRGDVYTTTVTLTIPNNLSTNTGYGVGAVIDENNTIAEAVEWNNATLHPNPRPGAESVSVSRRRGRFWQKGRAIGKAVAQ